MNSKRILATGALIALLALQACASTFVASKDGKGYYVGSSSDAAYRMFCESGDLQRILAATTTIGQDQKEELYGFQLRPGPVEPAGAEDICLHDRRAEAGPPAGL